MEIKFILHGSIIILFCVSQCFGQNELESRQKIADRGEANEKIYEQFNDNDGKSNSTKALPFCQTGKLSAAH